MENIAFLPAELIPSFKQQEKEEGKFTSQTDAHEDQRRTSFKQQHSLFPLS